MEKIRKISFGNKSNVFDTVIWHFANIHVEKTKDGFFLLQNSVDSELHFDDLVISQVRIANC